VAQNEDDQRRRRLLMILLTALLAILLSFLGSYLVVVSQNSASAVSGPQFVYGSPSP